MNSGITHNISESWKEECKAAFVFLLKLLILLCILKLFFWGYNKPGNGSAVFSGTSEWLIAMKWSLLSDVLVLLAVNVPFFVLMSLLAFFKPKPMLWSVISLIWVFFNIAIAGLNLLDIFYYRFHLQRADADLLYVGGRQAFRFVLQHPFISFFGLVIFFLLGLLLYRWFRPLKQRWISGARFSKAVAFLLMFTAMFFLFTYKLILPTSALTQLSSRQLPYVQNSAHSFIYSIYRNKEGMVRPYDFFSTEAFRPIEIKQMLAKRKSEQKNIVLFIMESVPEDFFNPTSPYHVYMPFFDSLLKHSTYFTNAFSYAHHSNKGITAILAGIPTLTEIPLYHSKYASLPMTSLGGSLRKKGYRSLFFIGDGYDEFGFAKAANWMGFDHYHSEASIPGHSQMDHHTMGLQDEYVLSFMLEQINRQQQPFLSVHYNISTHYPYDLPATYKAPLPLVNSLPSMKSMHYYSECLRDFFEKASKQHWYTNTVFLFCSDHWMYPDQDHPVADMVQASRIPIIIFDPSQPHGHRVNAPVSQLDIMNSILSVAAVSDTIVSYGQDLFNSNMPLNRIVFTRENAQVYQAIDSCYVFGYDVDQSKALYLYQYHSDKDRKHNLLQIQKPLAERFENALKQFLQTASWHYNNKL